MVIAGLKNPAKVKFRVKASDISWVRLAALSNRIKVPSPRKIRRAPDKNSRECCWFWETTTSKVAGFKDEKSGTLIRERVYGPAWIVKVPGEIAFLI